MHRETEHNENRTASPVVRLSETQVREEIDVRCDAFYDDPVMPYVIGSAGSGYDRHLRTLGNFFVMARVWRNEPVLAISDGSTLVAAATLTLPGERQPPAQLAQLRETVWRELGERARKRYEAFGEATKKFEIDQPHYHLNMLGVRRSHHGQGLARQLLDAVHAISSDDPASCGVTLTTEDPRNVPLYQHFGYRIAGHARVDGHLESWGFFRPDAVG